MHCEIVSAASSLTNLSIERDEHLMITFKALYMTFVVRDFVVPMHMGYSTYNPSSNGASVMQRQLDD